MTIDADPWQSRAACRDHDPEWWFPTDDTTRREAIAICATCPVRIECATHATRLNIVHGVWGGVDRDPTRQVGRPQSPCGTNAAYYRHLRNRESPCDACRTAHRTQKALNSRLATNRRPT